MPDIGAGHKRAGRLLIARRALLRGGTRDLRSWAAAQLLIPPPEEFLHRIYTVVGLPSVVRRRLARKLIDREIVHALRIFVILVTQRPCRFVHSLRPARKR